MRAAPLADPAITGTHNPSIFLDVYQNPVAIASGAVINGSGTDGDGVYVTCIPDGLPN